MGSIRTVPRDRSVRRCARARLAVVDDIRRFRSPRLELEHASPAKRYRDRGWRVRPHSLYFDCSPCYSHHVNASLR